VEDRSGEAGLPENDTVLFSPPTPSSSLSLFRLARILSGMAGYWSLGRTFRGVAYKYGVFFYFQNRNKHSSTPSSSRPPPFPFFSFFLSLSPTFPPGTRRRGRNDRTRNGKLRQKHTRSVAAKKHSPFPSLSSLFSLFPFPFSSLFPKKGGGYKAGLLCANIRKVLLPCSSLSFSFLPFFFFPLFFGIPIRDEGIGAAYSAGFC